MDASLVVVSGVAAPGSLMCIECEDVPANVFCDRCQDHFCGLCFQWLHRRGKRQQHVAQRLQGSSDGEVAQTNATTTATSDSASTTPAAGPVEGTTEYFIQQQQQQQQRRQQQQQRATPTEDVDAMAIEQDLIAAITAEQEEGQAQELDLEQQQQQQQQQEQDDSASELLSKLLSATKTDVRQEVQRLAQRVKFIPLRLSEDERVLLRLLEGALEVSEYTDKVDVSNDYYGWTGSSFYNNSTSASKTDIIKRELGDFFSIISGLLVANDFRSGSSHTVGRSFHDNASLFQKVFELGRRFKIMNPDKMRSTYGKMLHMLQDAGAQGMLSFSCISEIQTVHTLLRDHNALEMLAEPALVLATYVMPTRVQERSFLDRFQKARNTARDSLVRMYSQRGLTADQVNLCIDSISDSNSFFISNRDPVDGALKYLKSSFGQDDTRELLAIRAGRGGSCLTHNHATQYQFVSQSLHLWREIQGEMFRLWMLTDADILDPRSRYRLANTGQGLNRVQPAPQISRAMSEILGRVQSKMRGWVGLSVVHLGDRDVPNALVFIDKYTQVPRILGPIVRTLDNIPDMQHDPNMRQLIDDKFSGVDNARLIILCDYFRHGFDGSGSDGGSCIDGRLTSSWNWCAQLEKKPFHAIFLLACFDGFDGSFKNQSI
jgi:hypothetical protein